VDTPERVRFRYRLAGPGRRGVAWIIDFLIRGFLLFLIVLAMVPLMLLPGIEGVGAGFLLVALFLLEWGYGVGFEWAMSGRTPGKLVVSLRVVREDGSPGRFADFLLRNLLRAADFLPAFFAVGLVTMFMDRKLRRVGDLVAGTVVVVEQRGSVLGDVIIEPPVTDDERQALPARVDLTRQELGIIEEFLRRRSTFSAERAEELAWLFGPALSERTGITASTWERVLTLAYARATGKER
jgi:uncharacterized RDD family membrane protein YckC